MGMSPFKVSSSVYDGLDNIKKSNPVNPLPDKFEVKGMTVRNQFILLDVVYPNCTTYEGHKYLLFKCELSDLMKQIESKLLDPHFSNKKSLISPIARFEPTENGLKMALLLMNKYNEEIS